MGTARGEQRSVAVVGAGLGGLSAAIGLAGEGYRVTVYEKRSGPGGKAFTEQIGPYRFDTGPSLFTLRPVFDELFRSVGRNLDDYLTLKPLESICHYFWRNGSRLRSWSDQERLAEEFQRAFGEEPEHLRAYLAYSERIHRITAELFLTKSLHDGRTYRSGQFWSSLAQVHRIDAFRTMDAANASFFDAPHVRQFFDRYATYNGSDPYRTPGTLNIIPHVEYGIGAWAVEGGIYAVPLAMERLAGELGVTFEYGVQVERILTDSSPSRRVRGVRVDGVDRPADIVVSNADVTPTYRYLLEDTDAPLYKRYRKLEPSSSGLVFYWGVGKRFQELGLHNIFFSDDYRREFEQIFREGRCPEDPTIYINITSKEGAPGDAPPHGENWFVLVNAPADDGQDWAAETQRVRRAVLDRLNRELKTDIEPLIEVESTLTPPQIAEQTDSYRGSLYGIASNTRLAAFLRHPNRSTRYRGLYFVGGSAHPGGGMPLVVLGGRIVTDLVARHDPPA
ncbi:MAG: phytoene desaturase family protein [Alkalispirochaeta sp.]